jgi:hypothetical protein
MNNENQTGRTAAVSVDVRNLIAEYRQRREAWRLQAEELAHVETSVLETADREAARIIATARTDIQRALATARRELLDLAGQVQTIVDLAQAGDAAATRDRCLETRRDLRRVLKDLDPELDRLREDAERLRLVAQPQADAQPATDSSFDPRVSHSMVEVPDGMADEREGPRAPRRAFFWTIMAAFVFFGVVALIAAAGSRFVRGQREATPPFAVSRAEATSPIAPMAVRPAGATETPADPQSRGAQARKPNIAPTTGTVAIPQRPAPATSSIVETPPPTPLTRGSRQTAPQADTAPIRALAPPNPETRTEIAAAAERWLDAYHRRDAAGMATDAADGMKVEDQRAAGDRPDAGVSNVRRDFEHLNFQFAGSGIIMTARMTERANVAGRPQQYVSLISQVWMREADRWRLLNVRLITDPSVSR